MDPRPDLTFTEMSTTAKSIIRALRDNGFTVEGGARSIVDLAPQQVIALAEEVGEFVGAARRYLGMARRSGTIDDVALELADVIITAFVTAEVFDIELDAVVRHKLEIIFSRGWRE